ncbi:hypothetical protein VHUM_04039 [Vanrija humicola]|uniref:GRIP domain-containing protein n=1 Tax=Vanrija humicola TaxID=5417 RepID=A0A7D8UZ79_VANHU|nr:hypothetical protein VHUM_04039 [Vanrija humicola]
MSGSGILSPTSPRASSDLAGADSELERVKAENERLNHQYRSLLGKLTSMRSTLGEKLKEDAEELDRREEQINELNAENTALQEQLGTLRGELESSSAECASLSSQLQQLRSQSDNSSSDVLSLTREMRELRGEMERLRAEREDWETEAERERRRREEIEDEARARERREAEYRREAERAIDESKLEKERADNLQEVLSEFQAAKDLELHQATAELEGQLKLAVSQLSEFKLRAANAESSLSSVESNASRATVLEKELREKHTVIAKLRHDAVVTNEHLTEAMRRLRKINPDNNVDRRLVTNILLSFLTTSRADSKRFEMLSLLSTILSWDDGERERAGLQRSQKGKGRPQQARPEEEAAMNESFSNLFVEFLLKEASQGQPEGPTSPGAPFESPTALRSPGGLPPSSPSTSGATTPNLRMSRTMSTSSATSAASASLDAVVLGSSRGTMAGSRKPSFGLQEALGR